ncbi:hypothetical protein ATO6_15340 [Oceanicola sp. 22II-s10i]|uniref:hypothetical protein n=1 Tax=Oceanicola sp. 22II-s10i TaxID=1317116 RepID=UPI000B525F0F|nr:hypothetical protein [Oceanicola sp. 22II-s10i]OWU83805.1 hypothetical protein ATO6_15340 [Oceanicola sp. 22II-s10i]
MPAIYDWRSSLVPNSQVFRAGGQVIPGARTLGGFATDSPEPGGLGELYWDFAPKGSAQAMRDISWTASRLMNGAAMRLRLAMSPQLVPATDLNPPLTDGLPWASGAPWANDKNWQWNPWVPAASAAARGAETLTIDMTGLGEVLHLGHLIGLTLGGVDYTHMVMDTDWTGDLVTVTISPVLRRPVAIGEAVRFRPVMVARCANPAQVLGQFENRRIAVLNAAQFVEALV